MSSKPELRHVGEHEHRFRGTYLKTSCSTSSTFTSGIYPGLTAWVTGVHGLFLRVQFLLSDVCEDTERSGLTEALGVVLRDAKIWHALGLQASLMVPESYCHKVLPSEDLVLSLNHLQPFHPNIMTKKTGPAHTATVSALGPPTGISSVYLNSLDIEFEFSSSRHDMLYNERVLKNVQTIDRSCYEHMLLDVDADQWPQSCSRSSYDTAASYALEYPFSEERSSHRRPIPAQQNFANLVKLMDAGLRTILGSTDLKAHSGLEVMHLSPGPGLVEIAPSVFNPDYLKAVWQRSDLYPNIAHSLNAVYLRARSTVLRKKIKKLQPVRTNTEMDGLFSVIKACLWGSTTQGLAQQTSAQRIPRLNPTPGLDQMTLCKDSQSLMEHDIPQITPVVDKFYFSVDPFHEFTKCEDADSEIMLLEDCREVANVLHLEDEIYGTSEEDDMLMGASEEDDIDEEFLHLCTEA